MEHLKREGVYTLVDRKIQPNDAVMFDIDDTLIFTGGQPNHPIIELLRIAKHLGYAIVIITARPGLKQIIEWTIRELASHSITYDYLGFTSAQTKILMKQTLPYNFILSVGDMPTDLTGSPYALNISSSYRN
jgi:hydroxymethylpyrimidine pyrophosphatase-like HAD family hydrolase